MEKVEVETRRRCIPQPQLLDTDAWGEKWQLIGGQKLWTHGKVQCKGQTCTIHNYSEHHMRAWPQNYRFDRGIMERVCEHGVGHPDPDDLSKDTLHGCDGCCIVTKERGSEQ